MIGLITFDGSIATLGDDRVWRCHGLPGLADALNAILLSEDDSPARGDRLPAHVVEVAALLGGTARITPKSPPVPGRIY